EQRALKRGIEMEFEKRDFAEWQAVFAALDACVEPLLPLSEALEHPQLQARGLVARVPLADGGSQAQMACPIKFSAGLPAPRHIGAALGADTVAVLEGLGYSAERIAELKAAGAIA
ncbi:CoA transferase, partial [Pseudomonas aeruginosa]|uniref:CoA transferase n=1 Tax=Pseudomonas aeruginosa TaxID=287 RepID=UPI0004F28D9E